MEDRVDDVIDNIAKENINTDRDILDVMRFIFTELYQKYPTLEDPIILEDEDKINSRVVFRFSNSDTIVIGDTYVVVYDRDTQKQNYVYARNEDSFDSYANSALGFISIVARKIIETGTYVKSANKKN